MQIHPLTRDIVLVGGGHSHALVLRQWAMRPLAGARLTLINPGPSAAYSGMLPGFVAGHYSADQLQINLMRLARAAGARLVLGAATRLDRAAKQIHVPGRPPIAYDIASIDIGITTQMPDLPGFAEHAVPAKPLGAFAQAWDRYAQSPKGAIAVIGGGVAGAELAMAMAHRSGASVHVLDRAEPLADVAPRARAKLLAELTRAGVELHPNSQIVRISADGVHLADDSLVAASFIVGAAAPVAQNWPEASGLNCTNGFIDVSATLQSSDPDIFACGDCAHMRENPRPKAGVYAVRQAPVLYENLRARAAERPLRSYRPQRGYLKLISLGDKRALAEWGALAPSGSWMWRWKDRIDRRFMDRLSHPPQMTAPAPREQAAGNDAPGMMCAGCGAKVAPGALRAALTEAPIARPDVEPLPGDDAALLRIGDQRQVITTDHLRALIDDPYTMAQIATNHAMGDIWAMGATPQAALLSLTLPRQSQALQARSMAEIIAGVRAVLDPTGAALIGGHSAMGAELSIGLTLTGLVTEPITLGGARAGDALIVTKPLGSGVIMAADMAQRAGGLIVADCLAGMQASQADAAHILRDAHAMTDITGFGLAGHLCAMAAASKLGALVDLNAAPLLDGALDLASAGIRSSLWDDNRAGAQCTCPATARGDLMFDPQTAGGLLAAVDPQRAADLLGQLQEAGYDAAQIGEVTHERAVIFRE